MNNNVFRAQFGKTSYMVIPGIRNKYFSPEELIKKVCEEYLLITPEQLKEKTRKKEIVLPRQCLMKVLFDNYQISEKAIGKLLGEGDNAKNHATVNYSKRRIGELLEVKDKRTESMMQSIMNVVGMRLLENNKQFPNKTKKFNHNK